MERTLVRKYDIIFGVDNNRHDPRSDREIIRAAFDSIDHENLRAQTHLSPSQKLQLMFALIDQEQQIMFAEEKILHPDENEEMIQRRVRDRNLEKQDLSDKVRADVKEWIRRRENETTTL